ncbi:hypothetical protein [Candidatus Nitrosocosmicus hydrocola]|uniref:hypothetical protein n=1 Tax=Candidatus Nitrosocosmicus hydrocola TaxID=1826872 RepID=UPI0011E59793|nr:hypothetical protein [Candidatus Nitrosocosmicus hydrocola]
MESDSGPAPSGPCVHINVVELGSTGKHESSEGLDDEDPLLTDVEFDSGPAPSGPCVHINVVELGSTGKHESSWELGWA